MTITTLALLSSTTYGVPSGNYDGSSTDFAIGTTSVGQNGFEIINNAVTTKDGFFLHYTASAEL